MTPFSPESNRVSRWAAAYPRTLMYLKCMILLEVLLTVKAIFDAV